MSNNLIHLSGKILKTEKLLRIKARPAHFYIRYPYILEVRYREPSKHYEVNNALEILEFKGYKDYTDMVWKFKTRDSIKKILAIVKHNAPHCNIDDDIK